MITDTEMAWWLVEVARPCLSRQRRQLIFVALGSGDELAAIEAILHQVNRTGFDLPARVVGTLEHWLSRYDDSGFEHRFRRLIESLHTGGVPITSRDLASASAVLQEV